MLIVKFEKVDESYLRFFTMKKLSFNGGFNDNDIEARYRYNITNKTVTKIGGDQDLYRTESFNRDQLKSILTNDNNEGKTYECSYYHWKEISGSISLYEYNKPISFKGGF